MLWRNSALLILGLAMLLNTCVWVVSNAVATYYFKYLHGDSTGSLQSVFFLFMQGAAVAGALAAPILTRLFGKLKVFMSGSIIVAIFYGVRSEGMPYAFFSLMQKVGLAVGGAFAALMLGWTGYVANVEQTDSALLGINALFNLVPAGFSVLCLLTLFLYPISTDFFERITRELAER